MTNTSYLYNSSDIQKNPIDLVIELVIYEKNKIKDISTATNMRMIFKKPDGTSVTKTAVFVTDGKDGKLKYVTVDGDIDQAGEWQVQAYVQIAGTYTGYSSITTFTVVNNLI